MRTTSPWAPIRNADHAGGGRSGGGHEEGLGGGEAHRFGSAGRGHARAARRPPPADGTVGPKTLRNAAGWADGLAGITLDLDAAKQDELFDVGRTAWAQAGKPPPHLATSFWFAFGAPAEARAQVHRHLRHYMNWIPTADSSMRWPPRDRLRRNRGPGAGR